MNKNEELENLIEEFAKHNIDREKMISFGEFMAKMVGDKHQLFVSKC